jgi:phytoene/squalene synthetase/2-polyprenyl-6-methoxyphenol hydroxylase-like FAD-dependent oxidoreductase
MVRSSYDVVVIGAGPVGSVAAAAAARAGARVLMVEANPDAAKRFAGEWLHPEGVAVLDRLRLGRLEGADARTGYGFVVYPDDGSEPVELPYPPGGVALACEHSHLVESLRARAIGIDGVEYLRARVTGIEGQKVTLRGQGGESVVTAGRIIGADGRSSIARKSMGLAPHGAPMSYMASIEFRGVELPAEGYGHVVLGGPGPVLMYRIAPDLIRGCFDVPLAFDGNRRNPGFLWDAYAAVLPERLRHAFRDALERGPVLWAVNRFAPRALYGRGNMWLAGDSVGHLHPLTAAGMTLGFADAEATATQSTLAAYQKKRERETYVPELLSNALYHVFTRDDHSAAQIRSAVYNVWRKSPFERERTMRILMGAETSRVQFGAAFTRMAVEAVASTVRELAGEGRKRDILPAMGAYAEWARWPLASLIPADVRKAYRLDSRSEQPMPKVSQLLGRKEGEPAAADKPVQQTDSSAPPPSTEVQTLRQALGLAGDALLDELKKLHEKLGAEPDWSLMRRATRMVAAIDAADLGPGMAARMRLAKRPMARVGISRLRQAFEVESHAIRATDFASFMLSMLALDDGETIDRLNDGVRHLLACQRASGGFAPWPSAGAQADLRTTEMVCRALARCRDRYGDDGAQRYVDALSRARRFLLSTQREDGSWAASELEGALSNTAFAVRGLIAVGAQPSSPALRRATKFLVAAQAQDGTFPARADERAGTPDLTARAVHALLASPGAHFAAVQRALPHLVSFLERLATEPVQSGLSGFDRWERCAELVDVLAESELQRRERPRPEPSRSKHDGDDWTYCKVALGEVSRTFSKPIAMLPGDLEVAVSLGYLLCRVADTVEDHPAVPRSEKDRLFGLFLDVVERNAPARDFSVAFDAIEGDDAELSLSRNLARVMRVYRTLPDRMQQIVSRWVAEMSRGMSLYTHREPGEDGFVALYTVEDLERYCYYVAGTVGHMLTELFAEHMGHRLEPAVLAELRHNSEAFGAGLQLVNILKDVTDDRERRWSFVPRAACERAGVSIETLTDPAVRDAAHDAVAPLFDIAREKLDRALLYALSIPKEQVGVRLFCLLPLWMAALTLVHARGNDAMFLRDQEVKISRHTVEQVIAECLKYAGDDAALRARYRTLWQPPQVERHAGE